MVLTEVQQVPFGLVNFMMMTMMTMMTMMKVMMKTMLSATASGSRPIYNLYVCFDFSILSTSLSPKATRNSHLLSPKLTTMCGTI